MADASQIALVTTPSMAAFVDFFASSYSSLTERATIYLYSQPLASLPTIDAL
jgi:hypothetical protein